MQTVATPFAPAARGHYSQAVVHGGLVYVAGQLPIVPAEPERKLEELQPWDLTAWLERTAFPAGSYVGAWVSDGVAYVDVSDHTPDRLEAEIRGLERGELAIWDLTAGEEVRLLP